MDLKNILVLIIGISLILLIVLFYRMSVKKKQNIIENSESKELRINKDSNDKKEPEDKTEKYIALLQEGHITKADFMKLISKEQDYNNSYYG